MSDEQKNIIPIVKHEGGNTRYCNILDKNLCLSFTAMKMKPNLQEKRSITKYQDVVFICVQSFIFLPIILINCYKLSKCDFLDFSHILPLPVELNP